MSKKFLSLIHGDEIHAAPDKRIIKSKEFSSLLDAINLLEKVKVDEQQYRMEVTADAERDRETGRQEGFIEGMKQWAAQIKRLEEEIDRVHDEIKKLVVPIAIGAAKKIVGRELEASNDAIVDIVANALKAVSQHRIVTVFVNPQDIEPVEASKERLREVFDRLESLSVQARDDIERGGCIVETEAGIINAELEHQWRLLEKIIAQTMRKEEQAAQAKKEPASEEHEASAPETEPEDEPEPPTE